MILSDSHRQQGVRTKHISIEQQLLCLGTGLSRKTIWKTRRLECHVVFDLDEKNPKTLYAFLGLFTYFGIGFLDSIHSHLPLDSFNARLLEARSHRSKRRKFNFFQWSNRSFEQFAIKAKERKYRKLFFHLQLNMNSTINKQRAKYFRT